MEWPALLLVDKPTGITSFDVIRRLRRIYSDTHGGAKAPKLGHAGTLDPMATGLMLIGVGQGTKKLSELIKLDKEYVAEVRLGESRTTGDIDGEVVERVAVGEAAEILRSKISAALTDMTGTLTLPVSAYSAIKQNGVPLYKRARAAHKRGEVIAELPMREMIINEADALAVKLCIIDDTQQCIVKVRFSVGSGTYVRSLAEELGRRLGYPACLQALRRTKVGDFTIADARTLESLK